MLTNIKNYTAAILVRVGFIVHSVLAIWRAADVENEHLFWLLALSNVLLITEGIYRVVKKDGKESKW